MHISEAVALLFQAYALQLYFLWKNLETVSQRQINIPCLICLASSPEGFSSTDLWEVNAFLQFPTMQQN